MARHVIAAHKGGEKRDANDAELAADVVVGRHRPSPHGSILPHRTTPVAPSTYSLLTSVYGSLRWHHSDRPTPEPAGRGGFGVCAAAWLDSRQGERWVGPGLGRDALPWGLPAGIGVLDASGARGPCQGVATGSGLLSSRS